VGGVQAALQKIREKVRTEQQGKGKGKVNIYLEGNRISIGIRTRKAFSKTCKAHVMYKQDPDKISVQENVRE